MRHIGVITFQAVTCLAVIAFSIAAEEPTYSAKERSHWSFQPLRTVFPPDLRQGDSENLSTNPIDAFILGKLREQGLTLNRPAERRDLIRRITYTLTGLPPTPKEIEQFLNDTSPNATSILIDELLARPEYGEHWAQHWLDIVRFAESEGFEYDRHSHNAWMYRDYCINSFNQDKPFDDFVREQLAGDELADQLDADLRSVESQKRIAAGFYRLGPVRRNAGNPDVAFSRNEILTERTDIIGSTFLGLTVGCARCHDHKFDAIRQSDYYELQAYLAATYSHDAAVAAQDDYDAWKKESDNIKAEIKKHRKELATANSTQTASILSSIEKLKQSIPAPPPALFTVRNDPSQRTIIHLLDRGDETKPLNEVGMKPLGVLLREDQAVSSSDTDRPKLQLADWVADKSNPLTPRVIVNRVWHYHFGQGIVATPNDFGRNGTPPTHPELLDWLSAEFIQNNWSIKSLHRIILTSQTFQQSSGFSRTTPGMGIDPDNRLLWRFNRRRLSAEELRDSILTVSGRLNPRRGGPSIMPPVDADLTALLYDPDQWIVTADPAEHDRRSIYLIAKRNLRLPFLDVFDQPDLQTSCAHREESTHSPQALELMNSELANQLAHSFAERLATMSQGRISDLIEHGFVLSTGKPPTKKQFAISVDFLATGSQNEFALALLNMNSFLYVD